MATNQVMQEYSSGIKCLKVNIEKLLKDRSTVIIIPHKRADIDALASSVAATLIAQKFKKGSHILMGDDIDELDNGAKLIINQTKSDHSYINFNRYKVLPEEGRLNILCDVNPKYLIYPTRLKKGDTVIIDHHPRSEATVKSACSLISPVASSASEIMTHLLAEYKIKYSPNMANMLFAGILLDTNHSMGGVSTMMTGKAMEILYKAGADNKEANKYFRESLDCSRRVNSIIDTIDISNYHVGIMIADPKQIFVEEDLSKAANHAISNFEIDVAIAAGYIDKDVVAIKGRCNEKVDINAFMKSIDPSGGGRDGAGAVKLFGASLEDVNNRLREVLFPKHFVLLPKEIKKN